VEDLGVLTREAGRLEPARSFFHLKGPHMPGQTDYSQLVLPLLALAGGGLQWLRQYSGFKDRWTLLIAWGFGISVYLIAHHFGPDWRAEALIAAPIIWGFTSTALGGTGQAAVAGKSDAAMASLIPPANSK
jgi:hypothetical protein